ncbi:EAL domain-containing protein [Methylotuvimicrobium buryatense]|uniref:cyclic-guanylate-specific phosphodiesterase n=1 Tax=Methylotuvimicrobium buryatense TaxID=95641 RepID=A0A4P9UUV6_METBY|nr:EAL domain-containing protein [Methylotuvimicrobium buryatense]QCW84520.1 EAL domain-containing protein [Methylotuvimicrobium buryatense]
MKKNPADIDDLRHEAESLINFEPNHLDADLPLDLQTLFHELNVHQIELRMQNEQLVEAQQQLIASRNDFITLFDLAPVGFLRLDEKGRILQSNQTVQEMLGKSHSELRDKFLAAFIHADDLSIFNARYNAFYKKPEGKQIELRVLDMHKKPIYVELSGRLIKKQAGASVDFNHDCLLVNIITIGERKKMEEQLKLAAKVFEHSQESIMITAPDTTILKINFAFTAVTGYKPAEVIGRTPKILSSGRQSPEFYRDMWQKINKEGCWQGEIWNRRKNGDLYAEWLSICRINDKFGRVSHYIGIFSDITLRKLNEKQIEQLAYFDPLTELPNRALLNDRLKQGIVQAVRHKLWLSVFFLDLDRFKILNDTLGHFAGDLLLQNVAKRLKSCVRESDTVARFGGDEFVILLTDFVDEQSAALHSAEIAKKILDVLSQPFDLSGNQFITSTSIGFTLFPKDGSSVDELIKNADAAMYHAKASGRNNYQYFSDNMRSEALTRSTLENDLHHALPNHEFIVYYQPLIDLQTTPNQIIGFEALLRWNHPRKGLISPDDFIPIAEETGMIVAIGEWVLKSACKQFKIWRDQDQPQLKKICVNLSARQFLQNDLVHSIRQCLDSTGLDARFLEIEITETVMMQHMSAVIRILQQLMQMGITVSLDDFGTGYSSLTYLKKFPINSIKIDRSFVRDILNDPDDKVIVHSIISIARHMRLDIIAEGIENKEQATYLMQAGCRFGQGFLYSKPLPADGLIDLFPMFD